MVRLPGWSLRPCRVVDCGQRDGVLGGNHQGRLVLDSRQRGRSAQSNFSRPTVLYCTIASASTAPLGAVLNRLSG